MVKKNKKHNKDKAYKISKTDKEKYYDYIIKFEKELSRYRHNWEDEKLKHFLSKSNIKSTVGDGSYWIDLITPYDGIDKASSILKRLRNSMAHGNISKGTKYYYVYDYSVDNENKKCEKTLDCKLPVKSFWKLIDTICETRINE